MPNFINQQTTNADKNEVKWIKIPTRIIKMSGRKAAKENAGGLAVSGGTGWGLVWLHLEKC